MRLIDADALLNLPFERMIHTDYGDTCVPIEEIDNAPTVDLKDIYQEGHYDGQLEGYTRAINEERPQGEWIDYDNTFYKCPECGYLLEKCCPQCQNKVVLPKGCADLRGENNGKEETT